MSDESKLADLNGVEVEIEELASQGEGVGRLPDGRVVFVEGAAPGDLVTLDRIDARARFVRAAVGSLVRPSPDRVEPACAHFGTCGGCLWQHVDYPAQLAAKQKRVRDALERIGGLAAPGEIPITASPSAYGYRARARWVETQDGIGYRERRGRSGRSVESCPVLLPAAEEAMQTLARELREGGPRERRRAQEWVVTVGSEGQLVVTPAGSRKARRKQPGPSSVRIDVGGGSLRVSGDSFVQGNALLWAPLVEAVRGRCLDRDGAADASPQRFVELYAGAGFFTLSLARAGLSGVALENSPSAVADLRGNLGEAGLSEAVDVVVGRVESREDLRERIRATDLVLVDPPRTGLDDRVRSILEQDGPARLVYLSCDPGTLARDLRELVDAGYAMDSVEAFDLFPQTPHVETLVRLLR